MTASLLAGCFSVFPRTGYVSSLLFQVALHPPPKGGWGIRLLTNNDIIFCYILLYFNNINVNFRH